MMEWKIIQGKNRLLIKYIIERKLNEWFGGNRYEFVSKHVMKIRVD